METAGLRPPAWQVYTQCDRVAGLQSQVSDEEPAELSDRRGCDETGMATRPFAARWTTPIQQWSQALSYPAIKSEGRVPV
jgi:hypothetical protein